MFSSPLLIFFFLLFISPRILLFGPMGLSDLSEAFPSLLSFPLPFPETLPVCSKVSKEMDEGQYSVQTSVVGNEVVDGILPVEDDSSDCLLPASAETQPHENPDRVGKGRIFENIVYSYSTMEILYVHTCNHYHIYNFHCSC